MGGSARIRHTPNGSVTAVVLTIAAATLASATVTSVAVADTRRGG
jgi:hypothetical protein